MASDLRRRRQRTGLGDPARIAALARRRRASSLAGPHSIHLTNKRMFARGCLPWKNRHEYLHGRRRHADFQPRKGITCLELLTSEHGVDIRRIPLEKMTADQMTAYEFTMKKPRASCPARTRFWLQKPEAYGSDGALGCLLPRSFIAIQSRNRDCHKPDQRSVVSGLL